MNKLENLSEFTGTENYYTNPLYPFKYTDGIKYLAENGGLTGYSMRSPLGN
nr:DUF6876 family protein [Microcystis aeruginosa]